MRPTAIIIVCVAAAFAQLAEAQELKPLRDDKEDLIRNLAGLTLSEPMPISARFYALRVIIRGARNLELIDVPVEPPTLSDDLEKLAIELIRKRLDELAVTDIEVLPWRAPDPPELQPCRILNAEFRLHFAIDQTNAGIPTGVGAIFVEYSRLPVKRRLVGSADNDCEEARMGGGGPEYSWTGGPNLFSVEVGGSTEAIADVRRAIQVLVDYSVLNMVVASNPTAQGTLQTLMGQE